MGNRTKLELFERNLRPMQFWHLRAEDKLSRWKSGDPEGYSTGFKDLDSFSRLLPSDLVVIAARPSMGKTSLAMQMCESVARDLQKDDPDGCVAIFSAEMGGDRLYLRMASALCGVNGHALSQGKGEQEDYVKMENTMRELRTLPIWIDDNSGPTTEKMLQSLNELNETFSVRLMMFDFMELGGNRERNEEQRISQIAQSLKDIAKQLQIPVLVLSQLNRSVESRANKLPSLSDLRYSGMVEQVADVVMLLMRPEYYVKRGMDVDVPVEDEKGVAYVQFAKNRNGPVGLRRLAFIEEKVRFGDLERRYVDLNE